MNWQFCWCVLWIEKKSKCSSLSLGSIKVLGQMTWEFLSVGMGKMVWRSFLLKMWMFLCGWDVKCWNLRWWQIRYRSSDGIMINGNTSSLVRQLVLTAQFTQNDPWIYLRMKSWTISSPIWGTFWVCKDAKNLLMNQTGS